MITLFAALDIDGHIRFISEVPRGAACGCTCPVCASPLIAKQGERNEWHFAHEAGQERPECAAGALNLLRRLAGEYLRSLPALPFEPVVVDVQASSQLGVRRERVTWNARAIGAIEWLERTNATDPVARGQLDSGPPFELFVAIADDSPGPGRTDGPAPPARVCFTCNVPPLDRLRHRDQTLEHLARHGVFIWLHHPDTLGLVAAARQRVQALAEQDNQEAERRRAQVAVRAGQKWGAIGRRLQHGPEALPHSPPPPPPPPAPLPPLSADATWDWAPRRKPRSTFTFYRLSDGSAWVVYPMVDERLAIAPWPKEDGWDEALPPSVGRPDEALGVYVGRDLLAVTLFMNQRQKRMRITSDPREFDGL